jgi:digeranylgeranylglycerophospholipid reductase
MNKAKNAGATLHTGEKITEAGQTTEDVWVSNPQYSARGKVLVGADGPHSTIRSQFDFQKPTEFLEGVGAEVSDVNLDPHFVIIYTGSRIAPGFFAWIIPMNETGTTARVGLCKIQKDSLSLKECFESLLREPLLAQAHVGSRYGGLVPLGAVEPAVLSRVLLVGDAAGQVKPTSGGGIVTGLLCARACASSIHEALSGPSVSLRDLARYQARWKRSVGRELSMGMLFRSYYRQMTDSKIDSWVEDLQKPAVVAAISRAGDIDYPSRLLLPMLRAAPGLAARLPGMLLSRRRGHRLREEGGAGGT